MSVYLWLYIFTYFPIVHRDVLIWLTYGSSSWDEDRLVQNLNDTGFDTGVTVGMCVQVRH